MIWYARGLNKVLQNKITSKGTAFGLIFFTLFCGFVGWMGVWGACSLSPSNEQVAETANPSEPSQEPVSLVAHDAWDLLPPDQDPYGEERLPETRCPRLAGYKDEEFNGERSLEIVTAFCTYASLAQNSQQEIRKGDRVFLRLWHFKLTAREDFAVAHLALRIGDWELWAVSLDMPREGQLYTETFTAPRDFPKGTPILFHIHNHGANTYHLIELSLQKP